MGERFHAEHEADALGQDPELLGRGRGVAELSEAVLGDWVGDEVEHGDTVTRI
jgi:hypothetical protein